MPIYEYQCDKCGKTIEAFQRFSDSPLSECLCGGHLSKLMSLNSFHLKGSGWYVTDYAKGKGNQSTSTSTNTETKAEKAESKPKPEAKTDKGDD